MEPHVLQPKERERRWRGEELEEGLRRRFLEVVVGLVGLEEEEKEEKVEVLSSSSSSSPSSSSESCSLESDEREDGSEFALAPSAP